MSSAFNSDVDVVIDIGFGSGPYATAPTWTDVSTLARSFTIQRGRSHSLDRVSAAQLSVTFDNRGGDFDPTYTGGANYPDVQPSVPIRVQAIHNSVTYPLFYGRVLGFPQRYPQTGTDAVCEVSATDAMSLLSIIDTETAEVQELSDVRIGNLLDDASYPGSWRTLSTGDVTVQAYTPGCTSVLALIRQVEDTEAGLFFLGADGSATFQNRDFRVGASVQATFGDSGAEIRYQGLAYDFDDTQIWNRVEVSRVGGAVVAAENVASQGAHGERVLPLFDTLHLNDTLTTDTAEDYLARYKDPHLLVTELAVNPAAGGDWVAVLGLDISDLVTVRRRPPAGNLIDIDVHVESVGTVVDMASQQWDTTITATQYS